VNNGPYFLVVERRIGAAPGVSAVRVVEASAEGPLVPFATRNLFADERRFEMPIAFTIQSDDASTA
jgi:hypothetical protein